MNGRPRLVVTELGLPRDAVPADIAEACELVFGCSSGRIEEETLARMVAEADAVLFSSRDPITRTVLESGSRLRLAVKFGARPTNIDYAAARDRGITVGWTPGANARSVAEFTVFLTLAGLRQVQRAFATLAAGGWRSAEHIGLDLDGRTVGLVGMGAVGQETARLFRGLDANVIAYDPYQNEAAIAAAGAKPASLDQLIEQSDVISLHCQLSDDTRQLLCKETLARVKHGVVIVNTARGELIDDQALLAAIEEGRVGAAALDVFADEPLPLDNQLRRSPGIIATPHVAARSLQAIQRERFWALRGALAFLDGRPVERVQFLPPEG